MCFNEKKFKKFFQINTNQSYNNLEIVVSDNGSTDNSKNIIRIKKKQQNKT